MRTLKNLCDDVNKLRANAEKVPEKELKYGKYRKAYEALVREIRKDLADVMVQLAFNDSRNFKPGDEAVKKYFLGKCADVWEDERERGTLGEVERLCVEAFDVDAAIRLITERLWFRILYQCYAPYWVSRIQNLNGVYYSTITGETWDNINHVWTKDGEQAFTLRLPPTMDMINEEAEAFREQVRKEKEFYDKDNCRV